MKKVLSLVLFLCLLIGVCSVNASANGVLESSGNKVIASYSGETVPVDFKEVIEETGIDLTTNTSVELVSVKSVKPGTRASESEEEALLLVKNQNGEQVEINAIIPGTEDDLGFKVSAASSQKINDYRDFLQSSLFNVRITIIYDHILNGPMTQIYRPRSAHFAYTKKGTNVDMRKIDLRYYCIGALWSYPGFDNVQSAAYEHVIQVAKSSPLESMTYSKADALATNRCICTSVGSPSAGHSASIDVTVGSKMYSKSYILG